MKTIESARAIIKAYEGLGDGDPSTANLDPYLCPAGVWTIGWGHAIKKNGALLRGPGRKVEAYALYPGGITIEEAEELLSQDIAIAEADVARLVKVPLNENQHGALVSFVFNLGAYQFSESTLLRLLNAGDYEGAAKQFPRWIYSGGKKLNGLIKRREAERQLFVCPIFEAPKSAVESRTFQGLAVAAVGTIIPQIEEVKEVLIEVSKPLIEVGFDVTYLQYGITACTVAGILYAAYAKWDDRRKGRSR